MSRPFPAARRLQETPEGPVASAWYARSGPASRSVAEALRTGLIEPPHSRVTPIRGGPSQPFRVPNPPLRGYAIAFIGVQLMLVQPGIATGEDDAPRPSI